VPNEAPTFIFNDNRLVKAVAMALDRDEILAEGSGAGVGLVGWGPLSPRTSHTTRTSSRGRRPIRKARRSSSPRLGGKGPLEFEFLVSSGDAGILQLAQLIQAELAKADITATSSSSSSTTSSRCSRPTSTRA
jgi:ABC-type transport system substrate-binding protein